jgi:hypothetical protein
MDFLMLLPRRVRVVVELDGKQHYSDEDGTADPARYAAMVREDRQLRLGLRDGRIGPDGGGFRCQSGCAMTPWRVSSWE